MKNRLLITGILAFVLAWGMTVVGCDMGDDSTGENNKNSKDDKDGKNGENGNGDIAQLPEPVGTNELSGKTYDNGFFIITFKVDNTYTLDVRRNDEEPKPLETGFYSWNTPQQTVVLALDKVDDGFGIQNKAELRASCIEYYSSGKGQLPPGKTLEQYINMEINILFALATYDYEIEDDEITSFVIEITLADDGTTIAGCAYTQKVATKEFGMHYLLNDTFDNTLATLTETYGQPEDVEGGNRNSTLANGTSWVILEFSRYKIMWLIKSISPAKGWFNINTP